MRYLKLFWKLGDIGGYILMILGFFLSPFIIGIPIFILGILLLVFNFYKRLANVFIPKDTQEKIGKEIKKSYEPYQPAINSFKSIGKEIIKTAAAVFIILIGLIYIIWIR